MKKLITIAITTGMLSPLFTLGQVSVSDPSPNPVFQTLINDMNADVSDLFVYDTFRPTEGPVYDEIMFDQSNQDFWTNGSNPPDPGVPSVQKPGSVAEKKFVEISPNVEAFTFFGEGLLDVGFLGNSSIDANEFFAEIITPSQSDELLFMYEEIDDDPATVQLENTDTSDAVIRFGHDDTSVSIIENQSNTDKFKMFQAVSKDGAGNFTGDLIPGEFIFAIDDRTDDAIDYDDGFFYLNGDIAPVPEPSQIAALALLGLGGYLYIRRRRLISKN